MTTSSVTSSSFTLAVGDSLPAGAKFLRWVLTNGQEKPSNFEGLVEGYHPDYYFRDGKYLGPDESGVEPEFSITDLSSIEALPAVYGAEMTPDGNIRVECGPDTVLSMLPGRVIDASTMDPDGHYDVVLSPLQASADILSLAAAEFTTMSPEARHDAASGSWDEVMSDRLNSRLPKDLSQPEFVAAAQKLRAAITELCIA
jgi:hypothetical protein